MIKKKEINFNKKIFTVLLVSIIFLSLIFSSIGTVVAEETDTNTDTEVATDTNSEEITDSNNPSAEDDDPYSEGLFGDWGKKDSSSKTDDKESSTTDNKQKDDMSFLEKIFGGSLLGKEGDRNFLGQNWDYIKGSVGSKLGFKSGWAAFGSFFYYFFIGISAGVIIFGLGKLEKFFLFKITKRGFSRRFMIFNTSIFARNLMTSLVLGIAWGIINLIPVLNRIIQTITLTIFIKVGLANFFLEAAWLAILISAVPGTIKYVLWKRKEEKMTLGRIQAKAGVQIAKAMASGGAS